MTDPQPPRRRNQVVLLSVAYSLLGLVLVTWQLVGNVAGAGVRGVLIVFFGALAFLLGVVAVVRELRPR